MVFERTFDRSTATLSGNAGTCSCRFRSSETMSAGIRSGRVLRTWPNFTNVGPSVSSARRMRSPRVSVAFSVPSFDSFRRPQLRYFVKPMRSTRSPKPWLINTAAISPVRRRFFRKRSGVGVASTGLPIVECAVVSPAHKATCRIDREGTNAASGHRASEPKRS